MGVGQTIGVAAGAQLAQFDPIIAPIQAVGDLYSVHTACNAGTLVSVRFSSGTTVAVDAYGQISAVAVPVGSDGRSVNYLGFIMQDVITATQYPIELQFGYRSVLDVDPVAIWQFGRFRIPTSDASSTITLGSLVYPSKNTAGLLADLANAATDGTHVCPAVGWVVRAPSSAGLDLDVEVNLIGGRSVVS